MEEAAWAEGDSPVNRSTALSFASLSSPHVSYAMVGLDNVPRRRARVPSISIYCLASGMRIRRSYEINTK